MRTTLTIDDDNVARLRRRMRARRIPFKQVVNEAIRAGLSDDRAADFRTASRSMGNPSIDLTKALTLAGEMEDADLVARMREAR